MNGKVIIALGLLLIVLGGVGLYYAYEAQNPMNAALAWGAIIVGALALMGGIARFMTGFMAPQRAPESTYGKTEIRLLVEAMGAMAAADGKIADQEITTVAEVYERMLGTRIDTSDVREILNGIDEDFNIAGRLAAARAQLSPHMRRLIINCCYLVMMSDLVEAPAEKDRLHEIGRALGLTGEQVDDLTAFAGV